jgi:hypothetical protein
MPKKGSDSGAGLGCRYRVALSRTIAISAQLNVRDHGSIQRFMALAGGLIESHADPKIFTPNDMAGQMQSVARHN